MDETVRPGKYRHYKGSMYEIIGVARHSETREPLVIYRALYDSVEFGHNALWARPLSLFLEKVTVGDNTVSRFEYVEE